VNEVEVLLSRLAADQLGALSPSIGRAIAQALMRLAVFPESAPPLREEGFSLYRQVIVNGYRAIYRYFPDDYQVRVYCILSTRRQLPPADLSTLLILSCPVTPARPMASYAAPPLPHKRRPRRRLLSLQGGCAGQRERDGRGAGGVSFADHHRRPPAGRQECK
jgi:plasmid stabilization system protein ParE